MLLAVDMVTNSNDSGAGSLRDTIANASPGATIEFDMTPGHVTGPITLTGGVISISQNLKIQGPGAGNLSISGNSNSGVFQLASGLDLTISGLTISGGLAADGGAISNNGGTLKLVDDVFSDNEASNSGGAVYQSTGTLSMTGCSVVDNQASAQNGGGLYVAGGSVTIMESTFSGNTAPNDGGAIAVFGGSISLVDSTLASNTANISGGGLYVSITASASLINGTVAYNTADTGGGIDTSGSVTMGNTVVANNTDTTTGPDYVGALTTDLGSNILGNDQSTGAGFSQPSDQLNVNPLLGALGNHGGLTETISLLPGSPAIDSGSNSVVPPGVTIDQRGFYRFVNGTTDVGAFEIQTYVVTNTNDSGSGSLRTAMNNANLAGGSTVLFATSGTITLESALPAMTMDVDIVGPGANVLTIDGNDLYQIYSVQTGVTATLSGLTINQGLSSDNGGGGIDNQGTLTVTDCMISNSSAVNLGGGIYNESAGVLTLIDSTVSGNSSSNNGGGIDNEGMITLVNSTIAGNSAFNNGGGLDDDGTSSLINCTIADNSSRYAGGIAAYGAMTLANSIVAYNTLTGGGFGPDLYGFLANDAGYNLIGNDSNSAGLTQGSDLLNVDPLLSSLGNYGGPLETTALLPGSPAIDAGNNALATYDSSPLATDERGDPRNINGTVDIGAVECHGFTVTVIAGNNQSAAVTTNFANPLLVLVTSSFLEPVWGGVVTFTPPGDGASATFPGGSNKATTNLFGVASINVAANVVNGSYSVSASTRGASSPGSFSLTNTGAGATQLVIFTQPSATVTAGSAFGTQPVVYVEDLSGNLETGDNNTQVTVSLGTGTGPLQGTTTVTVSGGIATFTNLSDNTAETITLQFTSNPSLTAATSNNVVVNPAAASTLVVYTQPSSTATAGSPFATQPVVYVEDQYGNLETGDNATQVTAALNSGTGPLQGTTTVTVAGGIATFADLGDNTAETLSLQFTSNPALTTPTSTNIVVSPAAASQLVIDTQPSGDGDGRRGLQRAAGGRHRRRVRQSDHHRQYNSGIGVPGFRHRATPGNDDGDCVRGHCDVYGFDG